MKAYRSFFLFSILQSFNSSSLTYDQQILKVLTEAGEYDVSVQAVAKHVYNMNCTFFTQPDYEEIRSYVQQFLLRNSKSNFSIIENTGRRGYYRLNTTGSADARQMMLQFREETVEENEEEKPQQDLSLDLFA